VHKHDKRHLEKSNLHNDAIGAMPGPSIVQIAGELADVHVPMNAHRRVTEPTHCDAWKDKLAWARSEILQSPSGIDRANSALMAASLIAELASAEGIIGMRASPVFHGALPDFLLSPNGMSLGMVLGVRLAMQWRENGLPTPSKADAAANDQVRIAFESTYYGPLPVLESNTWAIDLVLTGAKQAAKLELDECRRARGASSNVDMVNDYMIFWQRVGQRLITSTFGLGAVCAPQNNGKYGDPWRMRDEMQITRDRHLLSEGCAVDGCDSPVISLAPIGKRRRELLQMLIDTERWLRTGLYENRSMSPPNESEPQALQLERTKLIVGDLILKPVLEELARRGNKEGTGELPEDQLARKLMNNLNLNAVASALSESKLLFLTGSPVHMKRSTFAYVAGATQMSPCCDCDASVHVFSGICLENGLSECTGCHAKRCLACVEAYAKELQEVTQSRPVGLRCRRCGAEPALIDMISKSSSDGELVTVNLQPRTPKLRAGALVATAPVISKMPQTRTVRTRR
jgi:hypothetical protein